MQQKAINEQLLASWQEFYSRYFNLRVDLDIDIIPDHLPGYDRLIVVVPKINPDKVIRAMRVRFTKVRTDISDVTRIIISDDRSASEAPYAIWVKDEDESGWDNNKNPETPLYTETLLEYLLHFFKTWDESSRMLNIQSSMLCTGTQMTGGFPIVRFYPGIEELKIGVFPAIIEIDDSSRFLPESIKIKNVYPRSVILREK